MSEHIMRRIFVEKVTLNIGAGKDEVKLKKANALLKLITGIDPSNTITNKRIATWGLRPGLAIGCKLTLRGLAAVNLLKRLLEAKDNVLQVRNFDTGGNFSFGLTEYIDIPGVEYDPDIKIMGLDVAVTLQRPGFRIGRRRNKTSSVSKSHVITKKDAIRFMSDSFNVAIEGDEV